MSPASLTALPASTGADAIIEVLNQDGAVIVTRLATTSLMDRLRDELSSWLEQTPCGPDEFRGWRTRRVGALCARSAVFRELAVHSTMFEVSAHFLRPHCARMQLMYTQLVELGAGETRQPLHRDDEVWPWPRSPGQEWAVVGMWAVSNFDADNGATLVVPGSHRWARERQAKDDEIALARMPKGSLLLHLGSVLHGGGDNQSSHARLGATINYSLGWLRQVENQYLVAPPELARNYSPVLQELLGYAMHGRIVGEWALTDPRVSLLGRSVSEVAELDRETQATVEMTTLSGYSTAPDDKQIKQ